MATDVIVRGAAWLNAHAVWPHLPFSLRSLGLARPRARRRSWRRLTARR